MADSSEWAEKLRDAILDNSALRDGLTDDEAQPLLERWLALADATGEKLARLEAESDAATFEELYETHNGALMKLINRITWVVMYRNKKGEAWTLKTLNQLNEFNRTLQGEDAPQLSEAEMTTYAQATDGLEKGALALELFNKFFPPVMDTDMADDTGTEGETEISDDVRSDSMPEQPATSDPSDYDLDNRSIREEL